MTKKTLQMKWVIGAAIALVLVGGASAARAEEKVVATVPFAFIVGDSLLPPGNYLVHDVWDDPTVVEITSADGRQSVFVITIPSSSAAAPTQPGLVFNKVGEHRFLAKVVHADGDDREVVLTPSIEQRELLKLAQHGESEAGLSR